MPTAEVRFSSSFPFPTQEGPPRRPLFGWVLSATGGILIAAGVAGGGLAGNGLCWAVLCIFLPSATPYPPEAWPLVFGLCVLATAIGAFVFIFGVSEGMHMRERGRRLRYTPAVPPRTGGEPVLLLRTFSDDELLDPRPLSFFQHRYEETLARTLHKLGPVVCIGRPHDSLGLSGAARLYVSDEHWKEAVCCLMRCAIATVILVGRTEGLWWEITTAMKLVERERLLFVFPYIAKTRRSGSRIADFLEFHGRWNLSRSRYNQMEAERQTRYQLFRQRFAAECNQSLPTELGGAFFLDFLPDGSVRLLHRKSNAWWKYIPYLYPKTGAHLLMDLWPGRMSRVRRLDLGRTMRPFLAKIKRRVGGYRYAGFWWRVLACIIDEFVLWILTFIVAMIVCAVVGISPSSNPAGFMVWALVFILSWIYFACFESSRLRGTPGKKACGLIVTSDDNSQISFGRATGRFFGKFFSILMFGVGSLMAGWTRRKQAFHDIISDCLVLKRLGSGTDSQCS